jgi:hypothetical protein
MMTLDLASNCGSEIFLSGHELTVGCIKLTASNFKVCLLSLQCLEFGCFGQIAPSMSQLVEFCVETLQRCEGFEGLARRLVGHAVSLGRSGRINNVEIVHLRRCFEDFHELHKISRTDLSSLVKGEP